MQTAKRRIAINVGGGYVPGLNSVLTGAVRAASELDWEVVGIRDGFDGLLCPERYESGGVLSLTSALVESLSDQAGAILGTNPRSDPFRVRSINSEHQIEEIDRSDELLSTIAAQGIDAVISIVGHQALCVLFRLHRKGLKTVCIPMSAENDLAATQLAFGFNSTLSFTLDILERARLAAQSAGKIGVVGVPGKHAGWLALQAGMTACADAVLIPEIPYDLHKVAARLQNKVNGARPYGLVVVADGAVSATPADAGPEHPLKKSLAPLASNREGEFVIERSGLAAHTVALGLQRISGLETYPLVLGPLVKGGPPSAVDRHLGLGYGAAAVRALREGRTGVMVALQPPNIDFVPLPEAINKIRTVPADSLFLELARSLGISLGD